MPTASDAMGKFREWSQKRSHVRIRLDTPNVSLSVIGTTEVVSASFEDGKFDLGIGELELTFLVEDCTFAYSNLVSGEPCLTLTFRDPLRPTNAGPPDAVLMLCELP